MNILSRFIDANASQVGYGKRRTELNAQTEEDSVQINRVERRLRRDNNVLKRCKDRVVVSKRTLKEINRGEAAVEENKARMRQKLGELENVVVSTQDEANLAVALARDFGIHAKYCTRNQGLHTFMRDNLLQCTFID